MTASSDVAWKGVQWYSRREPPSAYVVASPATQPIDQSRIGIRNGDVGRGDVIPITQCNDSGFWVTHTSAT
jgi:hypothetical protein